ncbi:hypothetical protein [Devosia ginsengisoli]|uniref:ribosome modulation factor n=1 Tax=Devosia ginsengisoli TaxID=400770 RepID=UPI0026EAA406|nr:hypothetical protein [Devosia ginsengisoli]MCR6673290.1 hypothetical protein [Devosia ginsengisoli]
MPPAGDQDDGPEIGDDDLDAAFNRGVEARRAGMPRKASPAEWRGEGFEPLMDAWVRGWTETEAP